MRIIERRRLTRIYSDFDCIRLSAVQSERFSIFSIVTFIVLLAIVLALAGCSHFPRPQPINPQNLAAINRVGVISLLGDEIQNIRARLFLGGSSATYQKVEDWGIDDFAENIVKQAIVAGNHYTYIDLKDQQVLRKKYFEDTSQEMQEQFSAVLVDRIKDELQSYAKDRDVDTLLILVRANARMTANQRGSYSVFGYGLAYSYNYIFAKNWYKVFSVVQVIVKDVSTMNQIGTRAYLEAKIVHSDLLPDRFVSEELQLSLNRNRVVEQEIKNCCKEALRATLVGLELLEQGKLIE